MLGRQERADSALRESEPAGVPPSPYSDQYETIISQGHARPTPLFGAPALVWHVAIWPRRMYDPHDTAGEKHDKAKSKFESRRTLWLDQIDCFIKKLQSGSCRKADDARTFTSVPPHDLHGKESTSDPDGFFKPINILAQEIVPFTLWWDEPKSGAPHAGA